MFSEDSKRKFTVSVYKKWYDKYKIEITERFKYLWNFFCSICSGLMKNSLPNFSKVAFYCTVLNYAIVYNTNAH